MPIQSGNLFSVRKNDGTHTHKDGGVGMRVVTVIRKGWDVKCEGGYASHCFLFNWSTLEIVWNR